jgi:hypothetical protein
LLSAFLLFSFRIEASSEIDVVRGRSHDPLGGQQFTQHVAIFFENQLDKTIGAGRGIEHLEVVIFETERTRRLQSLFVLADVSREVVVEEVTEELQHARLADAVVLQHADDLPPHVLAGPHATVQDGLAQGLVRSEVTQRMVDRQAELPVLEHDPAVRVGLAGLRRLGPEQRVAVEKDGRQPHEDALLLAELGDGSLDDVEVFVGFLAVGGRKVRASKR